MALGYLYSKFSKKVFRGKAVLCSEIDTAAVIFIDSLRKA